jgi:NAD(P)-dependent dehydrogenase (short-subunit alcohol dehydrogenase family)
MNLANRIVLVTGANRGLGRAIVTALLDAGVRKVYAASRAGEAHGDPRVVPLRLDLTIPATIAAAADRVHDVDVVVNNAGILEAQPLVRATDADAAEREMLVNYFGPLRVIRAFAPILAGDGGGVIVNVLSILSRVNLPGVGSYSASKAAALSMTQGARAELAPQGTRVIAVMPGFIDTDMTARAQLPKVPPSFVADAIIEALRGDVDDVYPGPAAAIADALLVDPKGVERQFATLLTH